MPPVTKVDLILARNRLANHLRADSQKKWDLTRLTSRAAGGYLLLGTERDVGDRERGESVVEP